MQFNLDLAIQIGNHLQEQDLTRALIAPEDIQDENDGEEEWKVEESDSKHTCS